MTSLGRYPMVRLKEARAKRDELAMMVFHGESPLRQKQLEKMAVGKTSTVHDFCERYFKEVIQKGRKDSTQLRRYFDKEIYPAFGSRSMGKVTAQDLQRLVFLKRDHGFESAAAQLRNLLKRIFDYAIVCRFAKNALNKALEGVNFSIAPFTIHDLRRTGSTILHEQGFPSNVVEKALNHTIGGVRGAYNRAEYADQRCKMLQAWADYVDQLRMHRRDTARY